MPDRWQTIEEIFNSAIRLEPNHRAEFLDKACAGDLPLRREVESLIASDEKAGGESFLSSPAEPLLNRPALRTAQLIGMVLDEKYRIDKQLGQGGMGAVFLAVHLGTKRPVAVKVIAPQFMMNEEFVERFRREAEAAGRLRHPNVVNVTDFGFSQLGTDRIAYLVMEYLDGCTLGDLLEKKIRLSLEFIVDIVEQVCLAVDKAHKEGIIHRDLKPDNIWLEPDGRGRYNAKVLDFGLAKLHDIAPPIPIDGQIAADLSQVNSLSSRNSEQSAMTLKFQQEENAMDTIGHSDRLETDITFKIRANEQEVFPGGKKPAGREINLTQAGAVLGTPLYMSPEQCSGEQIDTHSDIYSLGVIVYQMLIGETPFKGDIYSLIVKHIRTPPPPLRKRRRDISKSLESTVLLALAKDPAERPPSALAFAAALRANAEGEIPFLIRANDLYQKNRPTFTRINILLYIPFILVCCLLLLINEWLSLFSIPIILFANSLNTAISTLVVERLRVAPLDPVRIYPLFIALIKRLSILLSTAIRGKIIVLFGLIKFIRPGLRGYVDHALYAPVIIMEKEAAVLSRSKVLTERLRSLTIAFKIYDLFTSMTILTFCLFLIPTFLQPIAGKLLYAMVAFIFLLSIGFGYSSNAIGLAMLYFKARQSGGEEFKSISNQHFEHVDIPGYAWTTYKGEAGFIVKSLVKQARTLLITLLVGIALFIVIEQSEDPLLHAVENARIEDVKTLIAAGSDVNATTLIIGNSALIKAANQGRDSIVEELLKTGADINFQNYNGHTSLMIAVQSGYIETTKVLLAAGANVDAKAKNGATALMMAADRGYTDILKELLVARADINTKNKMGETALSIAAQNKYTEIEELLKAASAKE